MEGREGPGKEGRRRVGLAHGAEFGETCIYQCCDGITCIMESKTVTLSASHSGIIYSYHVAFLSLNALPRTRHIPISRIQIPHDHRKPIRT